jgi:molybdopterin molybdotransferase
MPAISVEEARRRILDGAKPTAVETVAIAGARGRTLAEPVAALVTQPPFDASAMDGFAVRESDIARLPTRLTLIGEAAAGHPFAGSIAAGQCVRIFTGAPLPPGADAVVIQEHARREGASILVEQGTPDRDHVRTRGLDFREGEVLLAPGRRIGPREVALAAAMGHGSLHVHRRPRLAVLATGDELVPPGTRPGPGQIICSNHLGVAALAEATGAEVALLGIARDTRESLHTHFAAAEGADVVVTIGGVSVGDHDLVAPVLKERGMALAFWTVAMRPGKPLMFGRLAGARVLGLPGNPVSALVCARVFLVPLIRALLGITHRDELALSARTTVPLAANGPRQHYMRACRSTSDDGIASVTPVRSQDSSLLAPLAEADCLLVRPPNAPALEVGGLVPVLPLDL